MTWKAESFRQAVCAVQFARGHSLRSAAKEAGVSTATMLRIQQGQAPSIETFFKLCRWMKLSPELFQ